MKLYGVLFHEALESLTDMSHEQVILFAKGFITGQAEKVSLGVCMACMFRPNGEYRAEVESIVVETARRYEMAWGCPSVSEIWIYHPNAHALFVAMSLSIENSCIWHGLRGLLCGIPVNKIDELYHLRSGANLPCDRIGDDNEPA